MQMRITVPNERERLADLSSALETVLANHGIEQELVHDVLLIAEEVVCNAMDHGFQVDAQHVIVVDIALREKRLHLDFIDDGAPFDPLAQPDPDLDADIADRPIGGLGVHLIRELAESVDYRRHEDRNHLSVVLRATR